MSVTWVVRFCTHCSRAFDVEETGHNKARVCDECKRRQRREKHQRWRQRKHDRR